MEISVILEQLSQDQLSVITLPLFFVVIAIEVGLSAKQNRGLYNPKDSAVSLAMLVFSGLVEFLPKILAFALLFSLHEISPLRDIVQRQWWAWLVLFLLDDFSYYWFHRANHEVRLFWAGHVPHHSSVHLNLGTALRQGVGERLHKFIFWLWLPLLGFDALMIFTMISISLFYQFWIHTEMVQKLPRWVELIFNTPSHHRVHHASNIRYLDRNHAGVLIIWDRLFGTFAAEDKTEPLVYGLTQNLETYNPFIVATGEYRNIWQDIKRSQRWQDKLRYLMMAPGWSHDGEDKRAQTLRAQASPRQVLVD